MRKQVAITSIFVVCLLVFLSANIWLENFLIKPFATDKQLESLLSNQDIESSTFSSMTQHKRTLIHITQSFCLCNAYSSSHIQTLNTLADKNNVAVRHVSLDKLTNEQQHAPQWKTLIDLIPSTPSTVLLNSKGKIEYIGPYSSGLTCNSENSFIEQFLKQPEGDFTVANWVNNGCYCQASGTNQ